MNKKGFTLIELLIVVAIIGILAAVGAVVIPNVLENAKEKSAAQNCQSVTDWVKLNFTNCSLGTQHITYKTSSGEVNVSCQQTGKQHSKYWVTHFTESGFSNPFNSSWRFIQESTNHIPNPNGSINFHCAVGSNTDNQCSFFCNNGATDTNNNLVNSNNLRTFLITKE